MQYNILDLVDEIRTEGNYHYTPTIYVGKVISPLPNISVQFNGMIFKKKQIKISQSRFFFDSHNTKTNIVATHEHHIIKDDLKLKAGDEVLLWVNNASNSIIIIDKVVEV